MKKIPKIWLLAFVGLLSCKDDEVLLPKATTEGLNTFGCKLNGEVWLPRKGFGLINNPPIIEAYYTKVKEVKSFNMVFLQGVNEKEIRLVTNELLKIGKYQFLKNSPFFPEEYLTSYSGNYVDDKYVLFSSATNELTITKIDTVQGIVSGSFQVDLKGLKNGEIIKLTEGIFDIKYNQ